jgi:hypothetical protein
MIEVGWPKLHPNFQKPFLPVLLLLNKVAGSFQFAYYSGREARRPTFPVI